MDYKLTEGGPISEHKARIYSLLKKLENIKCCMNNVQAFDMILRSRPPSYSGFVICYKLMEVQKTIRELLRMLLTREVEMHLEMYRHVSYRELMTKHVWKFQTRYKSHKNLLISIVLNIFLLDTKISISQMLQGEKEKRQEWWIPHEA